MMRDGAFCQSKIFERYPELAMKDRTILEIDHDESGFVLRLHAAGSDGVLSSELESFRQGIAAGETRLPLAAGAVDHVVCAAGFERLPPAARRSFIREMVRVARRSVLLSSSFEHPGPFGQRAMIQSWLASHGRLPKWLQAEHQLVRPRLHEVMDEVLVLGLPIDVFGDRTMLEHVADLMLRNEMPFARELLARQQFKSPGTPALRGSAWDIYHSYAICIAKDAAPTPVPEVSMMPSANRPRGAPLAVYACCHNPGDIQDFGSIDILKVGPAADAAAPGELTDILTDGTRLLNNRWSELSGFYRIWMDGPVSDVIGFCHYRRFFDFSPAPPPYAMQIIRPRQMADLKGLFVDPAAHDRCLTGNRIIVPRPFHFDGSPFHQYADIHNANDLLLLISLISKMHPELLPYARNMFSGSSLIPCNMFITRWALFEQFCPVWFGVLRAFEETVPPGRASPYQNRDISFLAERLFDVWLRYAQDKLGLEIEYRPMFFVEREPA